MTAAATVCLMSFTEAELLHTEVIGFISQVKHEQTHTHTQTLKHTNQIFHLYSDLAGLLPLSRPVSPIKLKRGILYARIVQIYKTKTSFILETEDLHHIMFSLKLDK